MALRVRTRMAVKLFATLARLMRASRTQAVTQALQDRPGRIRRRHAGGSLAGELDEVALHCASLPVADDRAAEDIIGYDGRGLPT